MEIFIHIVGIDMWLVPMLETCQKHNPLLETFLFSIKVALGLGEPKALENIWCFKVQKVISRHPVALIMTVQHTTQRH